MSKRVFLIVLDSCGIGEEPDARDFGDADCHTLKRISHVLRTRICHWSGWKSEPITEVAWDARQYAALKKGYHPDIRSPAF